MKDSQDGEMLFLLGRGRSGTTLLRLLLDAHSRISVAPEAMFVMFLRRRYGHLGDWSARRIEAFADDLWRGTRLPNWELDPNALRERLLAYPNPSFTRLCKCVYAQFAAEHGKPAAAYLGDKNPHYCLFTGQLMRMFPTARFVHLVRDPRDNVLSFQRVRFDSNHTGTLADRWNRFNLAVLRHQREVPERFHTLRYEDLLTEPQRSIEGLCEFLDLSFEPGMLEHHAVSEHPPQQAWHANLAKPLDANRAAVWKQEMPLRDVKLVETICGELMQDFGYSLSGAGNTPVRAAVGRLRGATMTRLEKLVFAMPFSLRVRTVNLYRRLTGSLPADRGGPA